MSTGHYFHVPPEAKDNEQAAGGGIRGPDGRWIVKANNPMPPPPEYYRPATASPLGGLVPTGAVGLVAAGLAAWGAWELYKEYTGGGERKNPRRKSKRYLKGKL